MKFKLILLCLCFHLTVSAQKSNTPTLLSIEHIEARNANIPKLDSLQIEKFSKHLKAAMQGSAKDMNAVGIHYFLGLGKVVNEEAALQWFRKAGENGFPKGWYNLGVMYKYGRGTSMDYARACQSFEKASIANEPAGWFGLGYMLYKGLGCQQSYKKAYALFRKAAQTGQAASMYFAGLCLRNGYGVIQNTDSARHWLTKAALKNYKFAFEELASSTPENTGITNSIVQKVKAIQAANQRNYMNNGQYQKLTSSMPVNDVQGTYTGFIVTYDYSGEHIIQSSNLSVELNYNVESKTLTGEWKEDNDNSLPLNATLTRKGLLFQNMQYSRSGHYDRNAPIRYNFETAGLELFRVSDTVFLTGNIELFSPGKKEPEKPVYIALFRVSTDTSNDPKVLLLSDALKPGGKLQTYPNPFVNSFTMEFDLKEACKVQTQIFTQDGKLVYSKAPEMLEPGRYALPIQVNLSSGVYVVKLQTGNKTKSAMVIKQ